MQQHLLPVTEKICLIKMILPFRKHGRMLLNWQKQGKVAVPAIPIDMLMNFYSFCIAHGQAPFANEEEVIDSETGVAAIETMKELYALVDKKMFTCNPIAVAELMSSTDDYWYCPFAYCYSNYSRTGYAKKVLHYTDVVSLNGKKLQTTIGGTGLAVSAFSKHKEAAMDFTAMGSIGRNASVHYMCSMAASRVIVLHGLDAEANHLTHDFFTNVLPVMDNGYVRPRYNGYLHFQDHAGLPLQKCIMENGRSG